MISKMRLTVSAALAGGDSAVTGGGKYTQAAQLQGAAQQALRGDKYWTAALGGAAQAGWPAGAGVFTSADEQLQVHVNCGGSELIPLASSCG